MLNQLYYLFIVAIANATAVIAIAVTDIASDFYETHLHYLLESKMQKNSFSENYSRYSEH